MFVFEDFGTYKAATTTSFKLASLLTVCVYVLSKSALDCVTIIFSSTPFFTSSALREFAYSKPLSKLASLFFVALVFPIRVTTAFVPLYSLRFFAISSIFDSSLLFIFTKSNLFIIAKSSYIRCLSSVVDSIFLFAATLNS